MFHDYFARLTGLAHPHPWQSDLATSSNCENCLIRVPTGFGKTLGVLAAWMYHRVHLADDRWPRRLVWCLPMRTLVEQTYREVTEALQRVDLLWRESDPRDDHAGRVGVHQLLGGADCAEWYLHPEHCAVLIGTQDMLLSRALNRGYGAARAHWPIDLGLLNQDCLWVMDEIQLMDVGLATSGQLQSFLVDDSQSPEVERPRRTWWMSATLQRSWLQISPDTQAMASRLPLQAIPRGLRTGALWDDVRKSVSIELLEDARAIARRASEAHAEAGFGKLGPTIVVLNRVDDALEVYAALLRDQPNHRAQVRLVHSRFRLKERAVWRDEFLNKKACDGGANRIIVATQVIEAGVDISGAVLVTQLAPWPSLVQRFGRCARWGGSARVIVADHAPQDEKSAAPYERSSLNAAREALSRLSDVSPLHLEAFEDANPDLLTALYPYSPKHLLQRRELHELFDTTPDLSGADIDVSRFIRTGEERDLQVFWQHVSQEGPEASLRAASDALCAIPAHKARDWLCKEKSEPLRAGMRAWVWDYLEGKWLKAQRRDLYPGRTVLVACECGGYDSNVGWNPRSGPVEPVPAALISKAESADAAQNDESLSFYQWQTIGSHGGAVGREATELAKTLMPRYASLLDLAGRWHDVGKAHDAFNRSIAYRPPEYRERNDLAKAPEQAWLYRHQLYPDAQGERRRGFRHELASTLALFDVLRRHRPEHPALLGPWCALFDAAGLPARSEAVAQHPPNELEQEILSLSGDDFDLLAYLVCSHHGKVRFSWHAAPADQEAADPVLRIRGVRDGDVLPPLLLLTTNREPLMLPASVMSLAPAASGISRLTGLSWAARALRLLQKHGPYKLAYLEALLRVADQRVSKQNLPDSILGPRSIEQEAAA